MTGIDFRGGDVVVTGGTGALGTAVVGRLLDAGAICHIPNFDADELKRFVHAGHERVHVGDGVDLTDDAAVAAYYAGLPRLWASLHIAGGFAMAPLADTTRDDFSHMMRMNALTSFLCCREAANVMAARPWGAGGGRLVNVAARPGLEPRTGAGMAAYAASKAAVAALTQALGEELAPAGIWVNAVAPSIIDTAANRAAMPTADHGKWPTPEQIAETIVFLASPANRTTRGAVVPVYGQS